MVRSSKTVNVYRISFREHTTPKAVVRWFYAYVLHFQKNTKIYLLDKCRNAFQKTTQNPEAFLIIFVTEKNGSTISKQKNTAFVLACLLTLS